VGSGGPLSSAQAFIARSISDREQQIREVMRELGEPTTAEIFAACWRLHLVDGSRPWRHGPPAPNSANARLRAEEKAAEEQRDAIANGLLGSDFGLGPRQPRKPPIDLQPGETMDRWIDAWLASRRAKGLTSVRENAAHYAKHIAPAMKDRHVREWTSDDMRRLASALDSKVQAAKISWKTAWNVWATASRICRDASASKLDALRCRPDNPARDVEGPDHGAEKSKQFLYPSEWLTFGRCEGVPLAWRRNVALAIYLFPRAG
jgi:hypothetical protein